MVVAIEVVPLVGIVWEGVYRVVPSVVVVIGVDYVAEPITVPVIRCGLHQGWVGAAVSLVHVIPAVVVVVGIGIVPDQVPIVVVPLAGVQWE
jgi:hypothetical protein